MPVTPINDATITKQVQGRIASRGLAPPCRVNVGTVKGEVTLSGTVLQDHQKGTAVQAARSVAGVRRVIDQLTVKPQQKF